MPPSPNRTILFPPATRTGMEPDTPPEAVLDELFATIEDRKETLPEESYTASLLTHE